MTGILNALPKNGSHLFALYNSHSDIRGGVGGCHLMLTQFLGDHVIYNLDCKTVVFFALVTRMRAVFERKVWSECEYDCFAVYLQSDYVYTR